MIVWMTEGVLYFGPGESGRMLANSCSSLAVTLTAITKLQPLLTSTSAGTLLTKPPSTSAWPLRQIGAERPGRLMLSRMPSTASPRSRTFGSPLTRSTVIVFIGIGNCSNRKSDKYRLSIGSNCPRRYLYNRYQYPPLRICERARTVSDP